MPPKNQLVHFELFRYQLLPLTQRTLPDMFLDERHQPIDSIEELKNRKNEIFYRALQNLQNPPPLRYRQTDMNQRVDYDSPPWFIMEINSQKLLKRERPDFNQERIDTWPPVVVIFNNHPDIQIIAVSKNTRAFSSGSVVAKILQRSIAPFLEMFGLSIYIEALFEKRDFWHLVEEYQGDILYVNFELISPNMANISKSLEIDLKQIAIDTNSHRTNLKLNSSEGSALELDQDNKTLNSIVDYASKGGGTAKVKVRGLSRIIHTSKCVQQISVEEFSVENPSPALLKHLLSIFK